MACAVLIPRVYCRPTENEFAGVLVFEITLLKIQLSKLWVHQFAFLLHDLFLA